MIKIKPESRHPSKPVSPETAKNTSTKQIAKNAVKGGPKDVKKDKRTGVGKH
jgi:hypothetical protein